MAAAASFPVHLPALEEEPRVLLSNMSPSRKHQVGKKQIARLLELYCLERDIPLYSCGPTDADRPVPDIALEVVVRLPAIDKLEVYRGLGVREVWMFRHGTFQLFTLRGDHYEPLDRSEVFPEVALDRIAHYPGEADQHAALRAFRKELRARGS